MRIQLKPFISSLRLSFNKTHRIIEELFDNERSYIRALKLGIEDYIGQFDSITLPNSLIGKRKEVFSNIELIHEFHEKIFFPRLLACEFDAEKIGNVFKSSFGRFEFDIYFSYAVDRKNSEILCTKNEEYFKEIQKDRLGIRSFLLQPIQRLPRYQMMLGEIAKHLIKTDLDEHKSAIAACCAAEKYVQRFIIKVNQHC